MSVVTSDRKLLKSCFQDKFSKTPCCCSSLWLDKNLSNQAAKAQNTCLYLESTWTWMLKKYCSLCYIPTLSWMGCMSSLALCFQEIFHYHCLYCWGYKKNYRVNVRTSDNWAESDTAVNLCLVIDRLKLHYSKCLVCSIFILYNAANNIW